MTYPLIAVVGPTASGKSELAVALAKKFHGEIISCDSRQIYRGMDIGTGKVEGTWVQVAANQKSKIKNLQFIYKSIPHHCIDFVNPKKQFSVTEFQKAANKAMLEIRGRGHLPILCGGTGHWVDAVAYAQKIPEVKPNIKLRKELGKLSVAELYEKLKMLDPERAAVIDRHNPRRLIRALEIVITTGKPVPVINNNHTYDDNKLWIGLYPGQEKLEKNIEKRLTQRLKQGMVKEVGRLRKGNPNLKSPISNRKFSPLSWPRLESFGLEYKFLALYLQKKLTYDEMTSLLSTAIKQYSKRQMTWFKKNEHIQWVRSKREAETVVARFMARQAHHFPP